MSGIEVSNDMLKQVTFQGVFEPTAWNGFSVYFPDLPGCASYGDTLTEAQKNAQDALALHLYGMEKDGELIPAPSAAPEVDPETAPGYLVRPVTVFPSLALTEQETSKVDKKEALKHLLSLFPEKGLDIDPEQARDERLGVRD